MPFSALGLSPVVTSPLGRLGYTQPTAIQSKAIPVVLEGRDLLARAETGTGKTAAFGLPMIERLLIRHPGRTGAGRRPRALVLVPTRELAQQVNEALRAYGAPLHLRSVSIVGGQAMGPQVKAIGLGAHVVVATPGRLIDHLERRTIDLSAVEILVLDEADRMLDMGFLPPLQRIAAVLPRDRQTLLLSATLSKEVVALSQRFTRDPVSVDVTAGKVVPATVTHRVHPVAQERKRELLMHLVDGDRARQTLVFCRTKHGSNRVCDHLVRAGVRAAAIHGNKSQGARTRALADFKAGRVTVLVATDLAARGLDIDQLPVVINFDLPMVADDYVHRIGRTGRAGASGEAVSLVSRDERGMLSEIQGRLGHPIEVVAVDGFAADHSARASDGRLAPRPAAAHHARPGYRAQAPGRRSTPPRGGFAGRRAQAPHRAG